MELSRICEVTDVFQLSPLFFSFFCFFFFSAIVYYDYSQMNILVSKLFEEFYLYTVMMCWLNWFMQSFTDLLHANIYLIGLCTNQVFVN